MFSRGWFSKFAQMTAAAAGRSSAFGLGVLIVVVWLVSGPFFRYSDTWQLVINTGTTIVTFLMVFLLQHTQNRDTAAIQIKLDELIRAIRPAANSVIAAELMDEECLAQLQNRYHRLAENADPALANKAP